MRSKWEVQLLTTVVAVCAVLYGVQAPVRAAQVTYNLENAELANGWAVTGSIDFDTVAGKLDGGSVSVYEGGGDVELFDVDSEDGASFEDLTNTTGTQIIQLVVGNPSIYDLTGTPGEEAPLNTSNSLLSIKSTSAVYRFGTGSVSDGPSVPEPSSIMATVTAVTLGVVLRRKKRKV